MNRSPFTSLLLPSMLTAMGLFTVLTLFFVPRIVGNITVQTSYTDKAEAKARIVGDQRSIAVRYVGISIMLGTSAGLLTFEGIRRWQAFQDRGLVKAEQLGLLDVLKIAPDEMMGLMPEESFEGF
jgi:hypothetical protein